MERILICLLLFALPARATEYLVKWRELPKNKDLPANTQEVLAPARLTKIDLPPAKKSATLFALRDHPNVEYVVENKSLHLQSTTSALQAQWALEKVGAANAWQIAQSQGSASVVVAVIDTGVDLTHESLAPNLVTGYDFRDSDNDPTDITSIMNPGHGTHCAGVVGATGKVDGGTAGSSPVVSIMPLRFLGKMGSGEMDDAIQAIDYAIAQGADIISASWGSEMTAAEAEPLREAIVRAGQAGVIFVTSAGNGDDFGVGYDLDVRPYYPASFNLENMITVGASDEDDAAARFSNFGAPVHVAAPGTRILSTLPRNRYDVLSGTSMAAPLVAGLVAHLKSLRPDLTALEARKLLGQSGQPIAMTNACNCRVDAAAAVQLLLAPYKTKN